ncbi:hypothetical protein GCM10009730_22470 [Streptomyces albidochromogenes]|uniref:hypothetical protein n=1 Tax=Streptomyces albidochromogenes TaxID=329524 RepID=UPI001FCBFEA4|nr:hypothetical protein [Streptomyces albidochromogenes]
MTPALTLFALVGCTAQGPQGDTGARPGASRAKDSTAAERNYTYRLPIAAYSYTDAEYASIDAAENTLAGACMARYSLTYRPPRPAPAKPGADRRYGLSEEKSATLFGYRPDSSYRATHQTLQLSKDERTVLFGKREGPGKSAPLEYRGKKVPDNGCLGQAKEDFGKTFAYPEGAEMASRISSQSYRESMLLPEVQAAFKKWSACMKKSGFAYGSPGEPFNAKKFREGPVTAQEKATARADVACKRSTDLLDVWFTAESRVQKTMITEHTEALDRLRDLHSKKVAAARKVVAEG